MQSDQFHGVFPYLVSPVQNDGSINREVLTERRDDFTDSRGISDQFEPEIVDGEMHHAARYERYPRTALLLEMEPDTDDEDIEIISVEIIQS